MAPDTRLGLPLLARLRLRKLRRVGSSRAFASAAGKHPDLPHGLTFGRNGFQGYPQLCRGDGGMIRFRTWGVACLFLWPMLALAETPSAKPGASPAGPSEVRRDPRGVTGISPYFEALGRGDRSYIALDFATARREYQVAITELPTQAEGHLRLAQVFLKEGNLGSAEEALKSATRYAGQELRYLAQEHFLLAVLRERQRNWDAAFEAWTTYAGLANMKEAPSTLGLPATTIFVTTAEKRKAQILSQKKAEEDGAQVRKKREAEVSSADAKKAG